MKPLSTTGYRPGLLAQFSYVLQVAMVGQFAMKARRCSYVFLRIRQQLLRHLFFRRKKKRHILML